MKLEIVFKDGRKETFDGVASFNVPFEVAKTPTEGKLFEINPLGIDRSRFEKPMRDQRQEWTRQTIQDAFAEVDKNPGKYAIAFSTLIPEKNWNGYKKVSKLKEYAINLGGQTAYWVEQALEWAQRIDNGESWKAVCNDEDTAKWYRMIVWKNGYVRLVGGSRYNVIRYPASGVFDYDYDSDTMLDLTVPLVVFKKK